MKLAIWTMLMAFRFFFYAFPMRLLARIGRPIMGFTSRHQVLAHWEMDLDFGRWMAGIPGKVCGLPPWMEHPTWLTRPSPFWIWGWSRSR